MQKDNLVVLAEYNNTMEAEISKSMLSSAGIWSNIRNEYSSATIPVTSVQLEVCESDFEQAEALLRENR